MTVSAMPTAWISGAGPHSGVGRVGTELTAPLRGHPDFRKLYVNGAANRMEETGPHGVRVLVQKRLRLGKSALALGVRGALPTYRAAFIDSQNLAFLTPSYPACIFVHDLFYWSHPRSWAERLQGHLLYRGLAHYDAILVNSEYTRAELLSRTRVDPQRVTVVPLGYDHERFHPAPVDHARLRGAAGLPAEARVVFHVSSGEPRKNLPRLLRSFAQVARAHPDAFFVKAGGRLHTDARNDVTALAASLGIGDRVRVLETLDDVLLAQWYRGCDVFALPSLAEGFGLPVLEAQACGTRIVTSATTALAEIAGPLCRTVDPLSETSIADALREGLYAARPTDELLAENAAWLSRFSWEPGRRLVARFLGFPATSGTNATDRG